MFSHFVSEHITRPAPFAQVCFGHQDAATSVRHAGKSAEAGSILSPEPSAFIYMSIIHQFMMEQRRLCDGQPRHCEGQRWAPSPSDGQLHHAMGSFAL
jgi:hypothetical protein